jgi:hypothetical protein
MPIHISLMAQSSCRFPIFFVWFYVKAVIGGEAARRSAASD